LGSSLQGTFAGWSEQRRPGATNKGATREEVLNFAQSMTSNAQASNRLAIARNPATSFKWNPQATPWTPGPPAQGFNTTSGARPGTYAAAPAAAAAADWSDWTYIPAAASSSAAPPTQYLMPLAVDPLQPAPILGSSLQGTFAGCMPLAGGTVAQEFCDATTAELGSDGNADSSLSTRLRSQDAVRNVRSAADPLGQVMVDRPVWRGGGAHLLNTFEEVSSAWMTNADVNVTYSEASTPLVTALEPQNGTQQGGTEDSATAAAESSTRIAAQSAASWLGGMAAERRREATTAQLGSDGSALHSLSTRVQAPAAPSAAAATASASHKVLKGDEAHEASGPQLQTTAPQEEDLNEFFRLDL